MYTQIWCYDFILFIMIWKFNIRSILLNKLHPFAWNHCISFLIAPEDISCFLTLAIVRSDWGMVGDLFWKKFKIVINELISLSKERIKRFGIRSFNTSVLSGCVNGNHCKSSWRVIIFDQCCLINYFRILHRYSTLLKQTERTVEKYWHC